MELWARRLLCKRTLVTVSFARPVFMVYKALIMTAYKIKPLNPRMPAINCGTDELPKWYLPEKLQILPYQLYKRMVPEALTSNMHRVACRPPDITRALVEHEGLRQLGLNPGTGLTPLVSCVRSFLLL
jgi:eukaryotic translation initiation factor 2C